jgi:hypothetical protein
MEIRGGREINWNWIRRFPIALIWRQKGYHLAAVAPVNLKMRINRQDTAARILFCHADQTGVSQGHGQVAVGFLKFQQAVDSALNAEADLDRTSFNKLKNGLGIAAETPN